MPPEFHYGLLQPFRSVPLGDVIDLSLLANARTFRVRGLDVSDVSVYYDPAIPGAFADSQRLEIAIGDDAMLQATLHPEDLYMIAAHEITHFAQPPTSLETTGEFRTVAGRPTRVHARDMYEQEAIWWEAQQAARFGWGREEYDAFNRRMKEIGVTRYTTHEMERYPRQHMATEERERSYAAFPVLSRRPVRVHRYRRHV